MISDDSFFRKIPTVIDLRQRLVWEAAGWAIDAISWSFDRLESVARQIEIGPEFRRNTAQEMFVDCWSIIDHCHMLRRMLRRASSNINATGKTATFIEKTKNYTMIRNAMDHLDEKINNLAKLQEPRPPIYGLLTFCRIDPEHLAREGDQNVLRGCRVISIIGGALTHREHRLGAVNPMGQMIKFPVGLFEFHAFEFNVNFSELISDLTALVAFYDTEAKPKRDQKIRELARQHGLDENKILNEYHAGAMAVALEISFDESI